MADQRPRGVSVSGAALVLALGVVRHYAYKLGPPEIAARVWNITGAAVVLALLLWVVWRMRGRLLVLVALWWAAEELLVVGCNTLWLVKPWHIQQGQDVCYPLLDFDLGKIGVLFVALILWRWRRTL